MDVLSKRSYSQRFSLLLIINKKCFRTVDYIVLYCPISRALSIIFCRSLPILSNRVDVLLFSDTPTTFTFTWFSSNALVLFKIANTSKGISPNVRIVGSLQFLAWLLISPNRSAPYTRPHSGLKCPKSDQNCCVTI